METKNEPGAITTIEKPKKFILNPDGTRTVKLPSGKTAIIIDFKGKHIRQATKLISGETEQFMNALIAITTEIDGKALVIEDVDDLPGFDVLHLMGIFNDSGENF